MRNSKSQSITSQVHSEFLSSVQGLPISSSKSVSEVTWVDLNIPQCTSPQPVTMAQSFHFKRRMSKHELKYEVHDTMHAYLILRNSPSCWSFTANKLNVIYIIRKFCHYFNLYNP